MSEQKTTHFGYQRVPVNDKANKVAEVFHSVADKYDVMNDLMSLGIHRIWKRFTLQLSGVREGDQVLDLAGGTGDLAKQFSRKVGTTGKVILADINASMLQNGRHRLINEGVVIDYTQLNAEALPFPDNSFDCISIAFGLRNVTHKDKALAEMHRVLKPAGRLLVLEFSKPTLPGLSVIYDWYSFNVLPKLGKLIAKDPDSYQYLAESIRMHPDQQRLADMMCDAGFSEPEWFNLSSGIVALHRGVKS